MEIDSLLKTYELSSVLKLKNRIIMAPMTRGRSSPEGVPTTEIANYYSRRAEAGLIITEGIVIRTDATGYPPGIPGIYTANQIKGWQKVTDSVHNKKGKIFAQIWHVGRASHHSFIEGKTPIAPSAIAPSGTIPRSRHLKFETPHALEISEIKQVIKDYRQAAINAMEAGFDGVELHGANGYLIDQFLHYHTNCRADEYGGLESNMARFAMETIQAVGESIGFENVGIRLSPGGYLNDIKGDNRDSQVFINLLNQLNKISIAYVHVGNFDDTIKFSELGGETMTDFIRQYYNGTLIASGGYTPEAANKAMALNEFDLVSIGRPFIANPDLISKLKNKEKLKGYDVSMLETLY